MCDSSPRHHSVLKTHRVQVEPCPLRVRSAVRCCSVVGANPSSASIAHGHTPPPYTIPMPQHQSRSGQQQRRSSTQNEAVILHVVSTRRRGVVYFVPVEDVHHLPSTDATVAVRGAGADVANAAATVDVASNCWASRRHRGPTPRRVAAAATTFGYCAHTTTATLAMSRKRRAPAATAAPSSTQASRVPRRMRRTTATRAGRQLRTSPLHATRPAASSS